MNWKRLYTYKGVPFWRNVRILEAAVQVVSAIIIIWLLVFLITNLLRAADKRGLDLGFTFISGEAGFHVTESLIEYEPSDSYGRAFMVGILNTLKVSLVGIVAATILGTIIGVARLSSNWLINKMASVYVEAIRNVPLLVQLFIWYFAVFQKLPLVEKSIELPGPIYISNRGVYAIWMFPGTSFQTWLIFVSIGVVLALALYIGLTQWQIKTGKPTYPIITAIVVLLLFPLAGWFVAGESPLITQTPVFDGKNFKGGLVLTPEFVALLIGLVIYTASFIAEIVRAGIQSVHRGQFEAARALGFGNMLALRLIIFPQAMRVIIPPLISQYLNLTKNSSLAIAIGFADVFFIGKTIINQAGRAIPVFLMIMAFYLMMSLIYAVLGNLYNRRVRLVER